MTGYRKIKVAGGAGVLALITTALVWGSASLAGAPGPSTNLLLTSGTDFSITSTFYTNPSGAYPATTCSGTPAHLYPGLTRCAIFTVHNRRGAPITVKHIVTRLDTRFPRPPAACAGSYLTLPSFSGAFRVGRNRSAASPGVPITLKDSGTNQDACENVTYHFVYWGSARHTDTTSTERP